MKKLAALILSCTLILSCISSVFADMPTEISSYINGSSISKPDIIYGETAQLIVPSTADNDGENCAYVKMYADVIENQTFSFSYDKGELGYVADLDFEVSGRWEVAELYLPDKNGDYVTIINSNCTYCKASTTQDENEYLADLSHLNISVIGTFSIDSPEYIPGSLSCTKIATELNDTFVYEFYIAPGSDLDYISFYVSDVDISGDGAPDYDKSTGRITVTGRANYYGEYTVQAITIGTYVGKHTTVLDSAFRATEGAAIGFGFHLIDDFSSESFTLSGGVLGDNTPPVVKVNTLSVSKKECDRGDLFTWRVEIEEESEIVAASVIGGPEYGKLYGYGMNYNLATHILSGTHIAEGSGLYEIDHIYLVDANGNTTVVRNTKYSSYDSEINYEVVGDILADLSAGNFYSNPDESDVEKPIVDINSLQMTKWQYGATINLCATDNVGFGSSWMVFRDKNNKQIKVKDNYTNNPEVWNSEEQRSEFNVQLYINYEGYGDLTLESINVADINGNTTTIVNSGASFFDKSNDSDCIFKDLSSFYLKENEIVDDEVQVGICGGHATWSLNGDGTLIISGTGSMADYEDAAPWFSQYRNQIKHVVVKSGITSIGQNAFFGCAIKDAIIANTVTSIGDFAFCNTPIKSITFPHGLKTIGRRAFYDCPELTSINIPASVMGIGTGPFDYCQKLTSINVDKNNSYFVSTDGVLFNKNRTTLIQYPAGKSGVSYMVPSHVTKLETNSFQGCVNLEKIIIPSNVTSLGVGVFNCSDNLKTLLFLGDCPNFEEDNSLIAIIANACYPKDNTTWTPAKLQNYGGEITWIATEDIKAGFPIVVEVEKGISEGIAPAIITELSNNDAVNQFSNTGLATALVGTAYDGEDASIKIELAEAKSFIGNTTLVFDVTPYVGDTDVSSTVNGSKITFYLPLTKDFTQFAKVEHQGDVAAYYKVQFSADGDPYIEISTTHFSKFTVTSIYYSHGRNQGINNTVNSADTGDSNIALYGAMAISSLMGMGWIAKKKH